MVEKGKISFKKDIKISRYGTKTDMLMSNQLVHPNQGFDKKDLVKHIENSFIDFYLLTLFTDETEHKTE